MSGGPREIARPQSFQADEGDDDDDGDGDDDDESDDIQSVPKKTHFQTRDCFQCCSRPS